MSMNNEVAAKAPTVVGPGHAMQFLPMALRPLSKTHVLVYRLTGGVIGGQIFGNRVMLLTTTGRKTGQIRTTPVAYLTDGDALFIIGGAGGAAHHPAWWLNLENKPEARIRVGRRTLWVGAIEATPEEQSRLWSHYPSQRAVFDAMQQRVPRKIPVVVLRPIEDNPSSAPAGLPLPMAEQAAGNTSHTRQATRAVRRGRRYPIYIAARFLNPIMRKLAGRRGLPLFAVVLHRGRRSGRLYATPVGARQTEDGFVIPLTFGEGSDWFKNVQAAGGCVIRWKGADYSVVEPKVVDWATARLAIHPLERVLMPLIGIERFVRLRHAGV